MASVIHKPCRLLGADYDQSDLVQQERCEMASVIHKPCRLLGADYDQSDLGANSFCLQYWHNSLVTELTYCAKTTPA